jgi:molecular chaperone DnaJ
VRAQQGFFMMQRTCPTCHGRGTIIKKPCKSCHGHGTKQVERTLSVAIPAGVEDGTRVRLTGEGELGARGGPRGDLYVFLSVVPHDLFERDNLDLLVTVPVPMTVAALGGEIEAPCLVSSACDGQCKAPVSVPAGAQTGKTVRIKGKGMPHLNGRQRGDLVVELFVETPTDLTAQQKALLQELAASLGESQTPRNSSFTGKAKRFWADILGSDTPQ